MIFIAKERILLIQKPAEKKFLPVERYQRYTKATLLRQAEQNVLCQAQQHPLPLLLFGNAT